MINKVIKNKQAARKVANEMKKDIHDYIDFFGGYLVNVVDNGTDYLVMVTSSSAGCKILTESVVPYIMEVFKAYRLVYGSIGYCVTVVEYDNDGYKDIRPAIQIEVYTNDK